MSKEMFEEFQKARVEIQIRGSDNITLIQLLVMTLVPHLPESLDHFERTMLDEAYKRIQKAGYEMPKEYIR